MVKRVKSIKIKAVHRGHFKLQNHQIENYASVTTHPHPHPRDAPCTPWATVRHTLVDPEIGFVPGTGGGRLMGKAPG